MFDPALFNLLRYVLIFLLVAPVFPLLYVVLRWRTAGEHPRGAGTYSAVLYFVTSSLLLMLAGAANLGYGVISTTPVEPEMRRLSWGLFVGAGLFLVLNLGLVRWVPAPPNGAEARRLFGGFLAVMAGMVTVYAVIMLVMTFVRETEGERMAEYRIDELKLHGAWTLAYLATYLVALFLLVRGARGQ